MNLRRIYMVLFFALLMAESCREPYIIPPSAVKSSNFLVVEGDIHVGLDSTVIQLTKTTALTDTTKALVPVTGATVAVETDAGRSFALTELGNGLYVVSFIPAGAAKEKYRVNIQTAGGGKYLSDFVESKTSPAIDSVSWEQHTDGVHVYTNTHDETGNAKYYKWSFVETWQYHAAFDSKYVYVNGYFAPRGVDSLYTCWHTIASTGIILQSTANLVQDVVYKKELMFIPVSEEKLSVLYSMLVKQTVLTQDGYNYWTGLSKNTEQLGSIFDALPSQLQGNIHSVSNPAETVVGFISATTSQQQRIFIKNDQISNWPYLTGFSACDTAVLNNPASIALVANGTYLIIASTQPGNPMAPFYGAPVDCADCRLKGGVNVKPPFWP